MSLTLAPTQQNWFPISPNTEPGQQYLLPPAMVSSWPEGQVAPVGSSDPSMNRKPELESELPPPETAPEVLVVPDTCCASEGRAQSAVAAKTAAVLQCIVQSGRCKRTGCEDKSYGVQLYMVRDNNIFVRQHDWQCLFLPRPN